MLYCLLEDSTARHCEVVPSKQPQRKAGRFVAKLAGREAEIEVVASQPDGTISTFMESERLNAKRWVLADGGQETGARFCVNVA